MKLSTHIMLHIQLAESRGQVHLAAGLAVLLRDALALPDVPLLLPKRPGVFGIVHPLDQLKALSLPYNESNHAHG